MFLREVCEEYFLQNPTIIGGEDRTVEIDEYNIGSQPRQVWIFGGYDPESKEGFLVRIPSREGSALLPIIKEYIRPGTTIVSDCWGACDCLHDEGYRHLAVNHRLNFVDPETAATTIHMGRWWHEAKRRDKKEYGTHTSMVDSYLAEFMWRHKFGKSPFKNIINQITQMYPV